MRKENLVASVRLALVALLGLTPGCGEGSGPETSKGNDRPVPVARVSTLETPAPPGSRVPAVAAGSDQLLLAWIVPAEAGPSLEAAVHDGQGWSPTSVVSTASSLVTDPASPPVAAVLEDGTLAVAWSEKNPGGEYASDLRVAFSRDGGISWSEPASPHRDGTATEHGFAALLPGGDASLDVVWLDGRAFASSTYGEGGTRVYHSHWDGETFGPETVVDDRVCDCCRTAMARSGEILVAAFRDRFEDETRDISVAVRSPDGAWSKPRSVHDDGWRLQACPANGPALAMDEEIALLAWFTAAGAEPRVRVALSGDSGRSFGEPVGLDAGSPVGRVDAVALGTGGFGVSWLEKTGGRADVRVVQVRPDGSLGSGATVGVTDAGRSSGTPRLAPAGDGRAYLAWTDTSAGGGVRLVLLEF